MRLGFSIPGGVRDLPTCVYTVIPSGEGWGGVHLCITFFFQFGIMLISLTAKYFLVRYDRITFDRKIRSGRRSNTPYWTIKRWVFLRLFALLAGCFSHYVHATMLRGY
jgi:hypothetical protein